MSAIFYSLFHTLYPFWTLFNISIAGSNKTKRSRAFFPVAQSRGNSCHDKIGKFTEKRLLNVSWNFNLRCSEVIKQAAWDAALKTAADKASKKLALFQETHACQQFHLDVVSYSSQTEMDRNSMNSKSFISTLDCLIFENFFEKKNHFDHRTFVTYRFTLIVNHFDQEH